MLGVYKDIAKLSSPLLGSNNAQPNPETEKSEEFTNIEQQTLQICLIYKAKNLMHIKEINKEKVKNLFHKEKNKK